MGLLGPLRRGAAKNWSGTAVVVVPRPNASYRRQMHPHHTQPRAATRVCESDRVRYLHLVAAARATAVRPCSEAQIADIVRVTVDDEVDTTTFAAIVADVATDILR
jgi:hypothetical protein